MQQQTFNHNLASALLANGHIDEAITASGLHYKQSVYVIEGGQVQQKIIASGLSMRDAIHLQAGRLLFPTIEEARSAIRCTHWKLIPLPVD